MFDDALNLFILDSDPVGSLARVPKILSLQESWHQTLSSQRMLHISGVAKRSPLDVIVSGTCHSKSHRLFRVALSWLI